jgi:hypothetical protein
MIVYHLDVTTFEPTAHTAKSIVERPDNVMASLEGLSRNGVVYVAALTKKVDYGNFYIFLNGSGRAHVMLHEHRKFLPRDPLSAGSVGETAFLGEDGRQFAVPSALTTSADRARVALAYWLSRQDHWPEFEWE